MLFNRIVSSSRRHIHKDSGSEMWWTLASECHDLNTSVQCISGKVQTPYIETKPCQWQCANHLWMDCSFLFESVTIWMPLLKSDYTCIVWGSACVHTLSEITLVRTCSSYCVTVRQLAHGFAQPCNSWSMHIYMHIYCTHIGPNIWGHCEAWWGRGSY